MGSHKKRVERLEGPQEIGAPIILVRRGETFEEAWQRHLAKHPDHEKAKLVVPFDEPDQDAPATKAETKISPGAPGLASRTIKR